MLIWLQNNIFTILIIAALAAFFGRLIYGLIRDKKKGRSSCCGGCAGCAMSCPNRAGACHPQAADKAEADLGTGNASADGQAPARAQVPEP